jgi:hypothetical protein
MVPSRRISEKDIGYPVRLVQITPAHMMRVTDLIVTCVETLRRICRCSLENEFTELIRLNRWMVMYLTVNQLDSIVAVAWMVLGPETPRTPCRWTSVLRPWFNGSLATRF